MNALVRAAVLRALTHHYRAIVSASHTEDQSGPITGDPAGRHQHLSLIPHPADEVPQAGVLRDVVVAGRDGHVHHRAALQTATP